MRVFWVWERRCADVRAGTQAPPLQFRLGGLRQTVDAVLGIAHRWLVSFVGKTVHMNQHYRCCTFVSKGLATIRSLPWVKSWRGTYAIGIVLFKINFRMGKSFAACGNDV